FDGNFDVKTTYEVFWSPIDSDDPATILKKQGRILTIDKEKEFKNRRISAPLPGYYYANILRIADSEEDLSAIIESKRGRKGINEKDGQKEVKPKKKKLSEVIKEGKKMSTENLLKRKAPPLSSDSDGGDEIIPLKIHNEQLLELKKYNKILKTKNFELKTKYETLQTKFDEVFNLNIELQKYLLEKKNLKPLPLSEDTPIELPTIAPHFESMLLPSASSTPNVSVVFNETFDDIESQREDFWLEESLLEKVLFRVKAGQPGDSVFVKNLSSAVFGDEILMKSSVTGTKCNAKKESVAKPALCATRLNYIK
ncbi:hypothetical protein JTE90_012167, partial [Oedothorax gibbosus]